jgi:hypothetical protein
MFFALYCFPFLVNEAFVGCSYFSYLLLGADYFQRDHTKLLNTYLAIRLLEEAADDGVHDAPARLTQAKTHTEFSFGKCNLLKLSYLDIRNFIRLPPAHQWLLGIIKKEMWGGFYKLLGPLAGTQWLRRCVERKKCVSLVLYIACC